MVNETVGEMIERDQGLLLPLSVGVIALLLWLIYRNPMGVIVPMAVIGLAVVWTLGLYAWQVRQLNVITSLLAPVIMILSLATAIHVVEAFQSSPSAWSNPTRSRSQGSPTGVATLPVFSVDHGRGAGFTAVQFHPRGQALWSLRCHRSVSFVYLWLDRDSPTLILAWLAALFPSLDVPRNQHESPSNRLHKFGLGPS